MAYKVFSNGDALTGGELNTYLMNQAVISFASTTARDAALPSPSEGQLVWLEDSNKYVYYTGSAWSDLITPVSSGNAIINSAFEINQRNFTSSTTSGAYGFDRWFTYFADGTSTYSSQTFSAGEAPVTAFEGASYARLQSTGQTLSSASTWLRQSIENVRTLANNTVTLSFYAKAASGTPKVAAEFAQSFGSGGSPSANVNTYAGQVTLSTSWTRYSLTVALPSLSGKTIGTNANTSSLILNLFTSAGSDFNSRTGSLGIQTATIDIWGVQLESGSTATAFKRNASSVQGELAACQRYYQKKSLQMAGACYDSATDYFNIGITLSPTMRVNPTLSNVSTTTVQYVNTLGALSSVNSILVSGSGSPDRAFIIPVISALGTLGMAAACVIDNIEFSAE
jgi:hypothetical protein